MPQGSDEREERNREREKQQKKIKETEELGFLMGGGNDFIETVTLNSIIKRDLSMTSLGKSRMDKSTATFSLRHPIWYLE